MSPRNPSSSLQKLFWRVFGKPSENLFGFHRQPQKTPQIFFHGFVFRILSINSFRIFKRDSFKNFPKNCSRNFARFFSKIMIFFFGNSIMDFFGKLPKKCIQIFFQISFQKVFQGILHKSDQNPSREFSKAYFLNKDLLRKSHWFAPKTLLEISRILSRHILQEILQLFPEKISGHFLGIFANVYQFVS